jgi:ATP-binding cassette subfamily G (WHITE) protein 2
VFFQSQHRLSYFVFTCAFYYYTSLEALPIFLAEREIFQREFSRGAYRAASYTLAQTLTFFPPYLIVASVYTIVTW